MTATPQLHTYNLSPGIVAFSTTRHGGYSDGAYGEFNINEYCGDAADAVEKNRTALAAELGIPSNRIIMPHQTHGTEVRQVAADFLLLPDNVRRMILDGVDAVMTDQKNVCVGVSTADCIPVLLHDAEHGAVCAVHAGWRGTLARIVMRTIAEMRLAYASDPSRLTAVIGPGISLDAFEVGDEVYEQFAAANFDMEGISRQMKSDCQPQAYKWHIDLPECNRRQLLQAGLAAENIQQSGICTYSNPDRYFSARRLGVKSGRIFTAIMMQE